MSLGLYIHIPFCRKRCSYCDFYLTTNLNLTEQFVESICKEIKIYSHIYKNNIIDTIFFGGGTPTALTTEELSNILYQIFDSFNVSKTPEITIECNPEDVIEDKNKFVNISKMGINRISLGIQSFIDTELKYLTRNHNSTEAEESIKMSNYLFNNVSVDIIYALPNQSLLDIEYNLSKISKLKINHVSAYTLILEQGTLMYKKMKSTNKIEKVEEKAEQLYDKLSDKLTDMGFKHYEVSNYAMPDYESRHNLKYWNFDNYLGLGPSAHSFIENRRFSNVRNLKYYNESLYEGKLPIDEDSLLNKSQLRNDYFISVFRSKGVDYKKYKKLFDEDFRMKYSTVVDEILNLGFAKISDTRFYLTQKGFAVADEITLKFIE